MFYKAKDQNCEGFSLAALVFCMKEKKDEKDDRKCCFYAAAFASPSGKMILFTKKKITIEMPPLRTVVPML